MPKLTPQEAQVKHAANLKASMANIRAQVAKVSVAPGVQAAAKKDKWIAKLQDPDVQAKWARNVAAVPLQRWQSQMSNVGVGRIPAGIDAAADKVTSFYSQLFPFEESLQSRIKAMPDTTISDSVARATAWIEGMAKFQKAG